MTRPSRYEATRACLGAALDVLRHEMTLPGDSPSLAQLRKAEEALALGARDLTNAIDDLPPSQQPKGWEIP